MDDQPATDAAEQARHDVVEIIAAVAELRRRADELGQATGLHAVADGVPDVSAAVIAARARIEQAFGMKLK